MKSMIFQDGFRIDSQNDGTFTLIRPMGAKSTHSSLEAAHEARLSAYTNRYVGRRRLLSGVVLEPEVLAL